MNLLFSIWTDIRHGENIDLYLTIIAAFGVSVLNIFGLAPAALIPPLTLAVLGVLTISTLVIRQHQKKLYDKLNKTLDSVFLKERPVSYAGDIHSAKELWLIGVTLSRDIKTVHSLFRRKLQDGHVIKVLLVHPESAAAQMKEERKYLTVEIERKQRDILNTIQDLCQLRKDTGGKLDLRVLRHPLSYGATHVNPRKASGTLYIEHYPYKTLGVAKPVFVFKAADGEWYDDYASELDRLWGDATDWVCDEQG